MSDIIVATPGSASLGDFIRQANASAPFSIGALHSKSGEQGVIGALQGIAIGGPTSMFGDGTFGRHLQVGVLRNNTEGNPAQPSLQLDIPGMWRFRWGVIAGPRTIRVNVKQVVNASPRPTLIVRANSAVGLNSDLTVTAGSSTGWIVLGPASFTATAAGPLWVELWNNYHGQYQTPCFFDHIIST